MADITPFAQSLGGLIIGPHEHLVIAFAGTVTTEASGSMRTWLQEHCPDVADRIIFVTGVQSMAGIEATSEVSG